ncbi:MAG TPA: precorrin-2 methylase [Methanomicrobia archaeon]|nr:precorrin-2 methylase [Methanomicrobia archaeon]HEX59035.1 precorrin-2 methylase [Methanomicrobia archaeon]
MLYGVGLGPGDKELLTLRALRVIKEADEVIVPGMRAYSLVADIREPRVVEFPMGGAVAAKKLGEELAERCESEDVAFCCLGDPLLYSTFHDTAAEVLKRNPKVEVRIIPGVTSFSAALAELGVFVDSSLLVTTADFEDADVVVVLKATRPRDIEERLRKKGYKRFMLVEKLFMEGARVLRGEMPERASYFSIVVALRG